MQDDLIIQQPAGAQHLVRLFHGVGSHASDLLPTLIGFSQGAIMASESTQTDRPPAGRVISLSGRFAQPPWVAPTVTRVHLIHGDADRVMPVHLAEDALRQLHALGGQATLDRFPELGHGVDSRVLSAIVGHMQDIHAPSS